MGSEDTLESQRTYQERQQQVRLGALPKGYLWRLQAARGVLTWEAFWSAAWPLAGLLVLFIAIALMGILPALPGLLHGALLAAWVAAAGYFLVQAVRRYRQPTLLDARRRLEVDSGFSHRPLTSLEDRLATGSSDRATQQLWQAHREQVAKQIKRIKISWPRALLAKLDPYALRGAAGLLLVIGLAMGHGDWRGRLAKAVTPQFQSANTIPAHLDVWINPPAYTRVAPLFLDPTAADPLEIPLGSTVLAQVQGGSGVPALLIEGESHPFSEIAEGAYKLSQDINGGAELVIEQNGDTLAQWPLSLIPDQPPNIELTAAPSRTERASLRIDHLARDDYGLERLEAQIRRLDVPDDEILTLDILLAGRSLRESDGSSYHDLTAHPWAGIAVELELLAHDAKDQIGRSETIRTVLPERIFNHPVARALVELRKQLTLSPSDRLPVIRDLNDLADRPDHYFHDTVVALALYAASRRLIHDKSEEAIPAVQQLMWDTALRIEEGELAIAERDLRNIQQALMDALARGAENDELEALLDDLQAAMDNFLEAMAEQMAQKMAEGQEFEALPPNAQQLNSQDLQDMIDQARELAKSGNREAARELLAQLQEMLENLRAQPSMTAENEEMREAQQMMRDLEHMMQRQQDLLNRSHERTQNPPRTDDQRQQQRSDNKSDGASQDSLRRDLGELMRQLGDAMGEIPQPLGRAEQDMRVARDALNADIAEQAVRPQTRSLDQLQQGMEFMADRFMQMFGEGADQGSGNVGARPGRNGKDPFGRNSGQGVREAIEGVQIPDQMEIQRAREIVDELRRRRGEQSRPTEELQYIDRLLKQF